MNVLDPPDRLNQRRRTMPAPWSAPALDCRTVAAALVGLVITLWPPSPAGAIQAGIDGASIDRVSSAVQEPDPDAVLEAAREAQERFERTRWTHLPWTRRVPAHPCDEVVGRFCFWHEDDAAEWIPPPEAEAVTAARERLLDRLAELAERLPSSDWIAGQRVRYLVEAGRPGDAGRVARGCRAERWWCRALAGYAHHAAGDPVHAGRAFDTALAAMPTDLRDAWTDVEPLLEGEARGVYRDLGSDARGAFERRFWWLADPRWSAAGNERRVEHLARHVTDRMQDRARSGYDVRWGDDLAELLVRYGWPIGWERVREDASSLGRGLRTSVVAHDPVGGRRFAPGWTILADPTVAPDAAWSVEGPRPRSTFLPRGVRRVLDTDAQVAVFRRGGGALVVAGFALPTDSAPGVRFDAALAVAAGPDGAPDVTRRAFTADRGALAVRAPWTPAVASVEAVAEEAGVAGRARRSLPMPGRADDRPAVSDLLLLAPSDALPETLEEAIPLARPGTTLAPGESIGLFFEIHPASGATRAEISIALRDERTGFWRGLGRALGLAGEEQDQVATAWTETFSAGIDPLARGVRVVVPDLPEGIYTLRLQVTVRGEAVTSERPVRIVE